LLFALFSILYIIITVRNNLPKREKHSRAQISWPWPTAKGNQSITLHYSRRGRTLSVSASRSGDGYRIYYACSLARPSSKAYSSPPTASGVRVMLASSHVCLWVGLRTVTVPSVTISKFKRPYTVLSRTITAVSIPERNSSRKSPEFHERALRSSLYLHVSLALAYGVPRHNTCLIVVVDIT
jgi:hypothetical protein